MKYLSSNFKRLIKLAARGNSKEIVYSEGNNLQKTIKAGDHVLNTVLKQNLNITLGQLSSLAIDAPKEAIRRSICFAPNIIRLAHIETYQGANKCIVQTRCLQPREE